MRVRLTVGLVFCVSLANNPVRASVAGLVRQGNGFYARQRYEEALGVYQRAEVLRPDDLLIHYNIGNTLYRLNRYPEAIEELTLAAVDARTSRRANALYNIGNAYYRSNRLDEALNAYRQALLANPADRAAKQNYEFCLRRKESEAGSRSDEEQKQQQGNKERRQSQNQDGGQPRQTPSSSGFDGEQARRILEQIQNQERQTQRAAKQEVQPLRVEKDW